MQVRFAGVTKKRKGRCMGSMLLKYMGRRVKIPTPVPTLSAHSAGPSICPVIQARSNRLRGSKGKKGRRILPTLRPSTGGKPTIESRAMVIRHCWVPSCWLASWRLLGAFRANGCLHGFPVLQSLCVQSLAHVCTTPHPSRVSIYGQCSTVTMLGSYGSFLFSPTSLSATPIV